MQKIYFVSNSRIPTQRAHGLHIMKMCEAFQKAGAEVELVLPGRKNELPDDPFEYYNIAQPFSIRKLWTLDFLSYREPRPAIFSILQTASFALSVFFYFLARRDGIIYFRHEEFLMLALRPFLHKRRIVCESHFLLRGWQRKILLRFFAAIVITNEAKSLYQKDIFFDDNIFVASDGVSLEDFSSPHSKKETRQLLKLPMDKKIVMYTGYFYHWKGADDLVCAAGYFDSDTELVLVGGAGEDTEKIQQLIQELKLSNVTLIGFRPYREMALYQKAADCLVVTGIPPSENTSSFTSPLKLFEYMASGNPIVASNIPSFRDVLRHNDNALLVSPRDPKKLADAIQIILSDEKLASRLAEKAKNDVPRYTWTERARAIYAYLVRRLDMPKVLYLFAGERERYIRDYKNGLVSDSQLLGLLYLYLEGIRGFYIENFFTKFFRKISFNLSSLPLIFSFRKYDIIFLGAHLYLIFLAKEILRFRKTSYVVYNTFLTNVLRRNKRGLRSFILRHSLKAADAIVCPSKAQKKFLESQGFDPKKIHFIRNGVDSEFFKPEKAQDTITSKNRMILSIGKDIGRDYQTLINALPGISVHGVIVAARRNISHIPEIPKNIRIVYDISQQETRDLYKKSFICVVPTFREDNSAASDCSGQTVLLESMASGKAVIVSDRSYLQDYVRHGVDAYVVWPEDPIALKNAIEYFLTHPDVALEIGKRARETIERTCTSRQFSMALSSIFKDVDKYYERRF